MNRIVFFTGAGMSRESGLPHFAAMAVCGTNLMSRL